MANLEKENDDFDVKETKCQQICKYTVKGLKLFIEFLFSHVGLACVVAGYTMLGGLVFQALELPRETEVRQFVIDTQDVYVDKIVDFLDVQNADAALNTETFNKRVGKLLANYEQEIHKATKQRDWDGRFGDEDYQWTFANSLLFSVTVITTIGYGNIAPKTWYGRLVTIVYAIFGIPLTMLCLRNIGNSLAGFFRLFYRCACVNMTYQYIKLRRRRIRQKFVKQLRMKTEGIRKWAKKSSLVQSVLHNNSTRTSSIRSDVSETKTEHGGFDFSNAPQHTIEHMPYIDEDLPPVIIEENDSELIQRFVNATSENHKSHYKRRNSIGVITQDYGNKSVSPRKHSLAPIKCQHTALGAHHSMRKLCKQNSTTSELTVIPENSTEFLFDDIKTLSTVGRDGDLDLASPTESSLCLNDFEEDDLILKARLKSTRNLVPISMCLLLVTGYIILGAMIFTPWEDSWDFLVGFYFCFVTLTTIGFGDFVPGMGNSSWNSDEKRVFCVLYLLFGMALLAMSFHLIQEEVKHKCRKMAIKIGLIEEKLTQILDSYAVD